MKQSLRNGAPGSIRFGGPFWSERKKTVTAVCLIAVMAFMWARVLGGKTPKGAEASLIMPGMVDDQPDLQVKVSYTDLPKVEGRNDRLARDFFASNGWRRFAAGGEDKDPATVNVVSSGDNEELIKRVAQKLNLSAIVLDESPQAFINDKLLLVGDKLIIKEGVDAYEFEVVGIQENVVFMRCKEAEITLRIPAVSKTEN
ncbi:MAG: hypothetical protein ACYTBJ_02755 [Planctomycetota bacterium]|jgi:hypothetical protein